MQRDPSGLSRRSLTAATVAVSWGWVGSPANLHEERGCRTSWRRRPSDFEPLATETRAVEVSPGRETFPPLGHLPLLRHSWRLGRWIVPKSGRTADANPRCSVNHRLRSGRALEGIDVRTACRPHPAQARQGRGPAPGKAGAGQSLVELWWKRKSAFWYVIVCSPVTAQADNAKLAVGSCGFKQTGELKTDAVPAEIK